MRIARTLDYKNVIPLLERSTQEAVMKNYHFSHTQQSTSPDLTYCECVECGHKIVLNNPCLLEGKLVYLLYCDLCFNGEDTYVVFDLTDDEFKALFLAGIPILDQMDEVEICDQ